MAACGVGGTPSEKMNSKIGAVYRRLRPLGVTMTPVIDRVQPGAPGPQMRVGEGTPRPWRTGGSATVRAPFMLSMSIVKGLR